LVNPNTVQKAYDELEREGLIYPRRGVGMFVTERDGRPAKVGGEDAVLAALRRVIEAARATEIPAERLRQLFEQALKSDGQVTGGRR
jgi:GntR family transcriptional regulator